MSFYAAKITPADKWFSLYIRFCDDWTCVACGKYCLRRKANNPDMPMAKIECAHIFSRSHKSIRHDPDNAVALCFKCHEKYTENAPAWEAFIKGKYGVDHWNKLLVKKKSVCKYKDEKAVAAMYRGAVMELAKKKGLLWLFKK